MNSRLIVLILTGVALLTVIPAYSETPADIPEVSIKQIMEALITPITNILWGADDPKTDEEWKILEDAAIAVIASGPLINLGGTGPEDNHWVTQPAWRAFSAAMTSAGKDSLKAIRNRDMEALFEAGDALLAPCEGCHLQFNPGLTR